MNFVGTYNWAGAITFTGLVLAMAAMMLSYHTNLSWAMVCLMGCGICDLFDGWVARKLNRTPSETAFGLQIDSLADMAAFGLTPVIVLLHSGFHGWVDFFGYGLYISAAAMRLAHFNQSQTDSDGAPQHYTGLPVTYAALVFPVVVWITLKTPPQIYLWAVRLTVVIMAVLFVYNIRVPKPKGKAYAGFTLLAVAMAIAWLSVSP